MNFKFLLVWLLIFSGEHWSVQSLSRVQLFETPWTAVGFPVHHQIMKLAQTHSLRNKTRDIITDSIGFSSVQSLSGVRLFATSWIAACQASLSVHHQLSELTQTHVHRVSDTIQPSRPLSSPSTPTPNPLQHQGLFQWVNSWHEVAKVLEFQL